MATTLVHQLGRRYVNLHHAVDGPPVGAYSEQLPGERKETRAPSTANTLR